jgi:hypothetical protein
MGDQVIARPLHKIGTHKIWTYMPQMESEPMIPVFRQYMPQTI